ncbi:MAG: hypothetical protein HZB23_08665 [Deltaproteobacteria bacterium]|nr:hypothetical protein [Deltaproteobacteria bacterium]
MEDKGFGDYQARLSALKDRYAAAALELASLRSNFFAQYPMARHIGDAQWVEIYWLIHELWETSPQQEIHHAGPLPDSAARKPEDAPADSPMVCAVCGFPLTGRQRLYCGEACKKKATRKNSRRTAAVN